MTIKLFLSLLLISSTVCSLNAETFTSGNKQTSLLELYSSQGCSSCPPAERWISSLLDNNGLWSEFIPVVYHVDYWNYLGWRDPFSNPVFSQRQRTYHKQNAISSVYTPGFVLNGEEWRLWFLQKSVPSGSQQAKILKASFDGNILSASYDLNTPLILNAAILGFNIETSVNAGENQGRKFSENFIVLNQTTIQSDSGEWKFKINVPKPAKAERYALAIWVHSPNSLKPLQATGGWINPLNSQ